METTPKQPVEPERRSTRLRKPPSYLASTYKSTHNSCFYTQLYRFVYLSPTLGLATKHDTALVSVFMPQEHQHTLNSTGHWYSGQLYVKHYVVH